MDRIIYLAIAGALGTLARYGLGGLVQRLAGAGFPWGTLVVNLLGCFVFGLLWILMESRIHTRPEIRTVVFIGFLGAFTTFSTFVFETSNLIGDSQWLYALANFLVHNGVGIAALIGGMAVGRMV